MELILEHDELRAVLMQFWRSTGVVLPDNAKLIIRTNNKKMTARAVISTAEAKRGK
jgi:hypothetical protein